jgi:hypothetical protein
MCTARTRGRRRAACNTPSGAYHAQQCHVSSDVQHATWHVPCTQQCRAWYDMRHAAQNPADVRQRDEGGDGQSLVCVPTAPLPTALRPREPWSTTVPLPRRAWGRRVERYLLHNARRAEHAVREGSAQAAQQPLVHAAVEADPRPHERPRRRVVHQAVRMPYARPPAQGRVLRPMGVLASSNPRGLPAHTPTQQGGREVGR